MSHCRVVKHGEVLITLLKKKIKGTLDQYITTQSQANFTIISHFC